MKSFRSRCRLGDFWFVFKLVNDDARPTMTSPIQSVPDCGCWRWAPPWRKLAAYAVAAATKLKDFAPYALLELVLPGGSLMALLLWLYRRHGAAVLSRRNPA